MTFPNKTDKESFLKTLTYGKTKAMFIKISMRGINHFSKLRYGAIHIK